jgi:glycosyltransferase involved in cell wall biosynthesis
MTANSNLPRVSVVIPTHNPRADYLARVLDALRLQTLPREQWEIIVIDNASTEIVGGRLDLSWHANARIVREEKLGLTFARLRGFAEAQGELIVMVDDDNVLAPDYLENAVKIAEEHKDLGAFGGKCLPEFETEPEPWMEEFLPLLALRDHGEKEIIAGDTRSADGSRRAYPDQAAPIGAGMVLRSSAARAYAKRLDQETKRPKDQKPLTDRKGDSLASAGDNDLVFAILRDGWKVGYFPQLKITHLIPSSRLTVDYLARANRGVQRSWVEVLRKHDACPWPVISRTSAPLRKVRAFFKCRGWQKPAGFTRWQACCGQFEGRIRS